jgi:TetR/AcrR family transcriptional regulator, transcriptional repressor for nem operon
MNANHSMTAPRISARTKLLDAAIKLVRMKGFAATSVDDLCREAGVTKGAFFHHFETKEALGVAAANYWTETSSLLFLNADYNRHEDPLDRYLGYLDFRTAILEGPVETFTCYAGTALQETFASSDAIRAACDESISGHSARLATDLDAAISRYGAPDGVTGESLGLHTQAVLQGAFILAKARGGPAIARESVAHLKRYVMMLFNRGDRL